MTGRSRDEAGYTLIEIMVATLVFAAISIGFYQVMLRGVQGSETTGDVAEIAEEARIGFARMLRDAREADSLDAASPTSFTVWVDFDGDGARDYASHEELRYTYDQTAGTITLDAIDGSGTSLASGVLMDNVVKDSADTNVFEYSSNRLEYDWDPLDGETTWEEIDDPPVGVNGVGDRDGSLDTSELTYLSNIRFRFDVEVGESSSEFAGEAQLRNRRFSV